MQGSRCCLSFYAMSKEVIVFILGIILLIVPLLGVPEDWKVYVYVFAGVILVIVGYGLRRDAYLRSIDQGGGERGTDAYIENTRSIEWPDDTV